MFVNYSKSIFHSLVRLDDLFYQSKLSTSTASPSCKKQGRRVTASEVESHCVSSWLSVNLLIRFELSRQVHKNNAVSYVVYNDFN